MMNKVLCAFLLLIAFGSACVAQNFWQPTAGPYAGYITAMAANSSGYLYVATIRGGIFRSTDNGATWSAVNAGLGNGAVTSLTVNLSGSIFAGTAGGGVFRSNDNGLTWSATSAGMADLDVRALASGRSSEVFAGTNIDGVYRSRDNGATWTQVGFSAVNENLQALIASAGGMVFGGSNTAGISRSSDFGTNWTEKRIGNVQALAFGSSFYVFAGMSGGGVFVSADNGGSWIAYNTGLGNLEIRSLAVTSTYVFAGTDGGGVYRSSDNGKTWGSTNFGLTNLSVYSLFPVASTTLLAGTYGGGLFKTTDSGLYWSPSATGIRNSFVFSLVASLRGSIYAGTGGAGIFRTTDEGVSWSSSTTVASDGYVQALLADRVGNLYAGTSTDGVYRSTDNGASWAIASPTLAGLNITSLALDSSQRVLATTADGFVYSSTDRGSSWTSTHPTTNVLQCVVVDSSGRIYVSANGGRIFTTALTIWISASIGLPSSDIYSILPLSSGLLLAGSFGDGIYRSTNGGVSWSPANTGLGSYYIYTLVRYSSGVIYAGTGDGVYLSTNNGNSWSQWNTGMPNFEIVSLAFSATGYLYAGTLGEGVYRTVNPVVSVAPVATTTSATSITSTTSTLNGIVALKGTTTTAYFEWGMSPSLASPNLTSVQTLVGTSGISVVTAPLTGLTPGTTYYFRLVAKAAGGAGSAGDILNFTTTGTSTVGGLSITVKDADGTSLPVPAVNGIVRLFSSSGKQVGSDQPLDASGTTIFTNVPAGSGYYYQVWHNAASMFGQVYWGLVSNVSITANATIPSPFVRNQPIVAGLKVFNGTADVTGQTVAAGSVLRLELTIQNPNASALDARGRFVVDRDKTPPMDLDTLGATYHTIPGSNSRIIDSVSIKPTITGDYYAVGAVQIAGGGLLTDGMVWSSTKAFTVGTGGLASPILSTPTDGSTGVSTNPTFSWNAVTGALSYQLQLSTSSTFQTILVDKPGISGTSFQVVTLANSTMYYWRVGATGTSTVVNWSSVWSFTTVVAAPSQPTLATPANGATNQPLSLNLSWNAVSGATSYHLQLDKSSAFTSAVVDDSTVSSTFRSVSSLANGTTYFWHVSAKNAGGSSLYSTTYSFATVAGALSAPTLSAPSNNATGVSSTVTVTWTTVSGATTYHIQVSTNSGYSAPLVLDDTSVVSNSRQLTGLAGNATYYWRVRAKNAGGTSAWPSSFTFSTAGTKAVASPGVSFPLSPTASTDYRLVSFPGTSNLTVGQVLSGAQNTDWRIFRDNGSAEPNNLSELSSSSTLSPGEGYWLVTKGTFNFSSTLTMPQLGTDGTYTMTVRNGWNVIGNPFDVAVQWSTIKADNSSTATLWAYSGTGGYQASATLDPFKGYYFYSSSTTLKIRYPFPSMIVEPAPSPVIDWRLQIALEIEGNIDAENYIGMAPMAKESLDELDQRKPPRFLDQAFLSFSLAAPNGEEQYLSSDFRPSTGEGQVWNFSVANPKRVNGKIRIIGIESVPAAFDVVLIDAQNTTPIDLRVKGDIPFRSSSESQAFHLIVGLKSFVQAKETELVPKEFELSQNYPNPFNPSTTITYKVPREATVRLEIMSLLGQHLSTLAQGMHTPGTYSVTWSSVEQHSSSGVYFARLLVDGRVVKTQKMTLLK